MGDKSKIEWTDASWNPTTGCSRVSAGCDNCYAIRMSNRIQATGNAAYFGIVRRTALGIGRLDWTGVVRTLPERLDQPIRWRRPRRIFVDSMSDLFHPLVPFEFVDKVWAVMAVASWHTFQILTKRPERMAEYLRSRNAHAISGGRSQYKHPIQYEIDLIIDSRPTPEDAGLWTWPLPNVWLGTSVEDQITADERIHYLSECRAAIRFLSCEPLLGPIYLNPRLIYFIDWVIVGGESGPGARPMLEEWVAALRSQTTGHASFYFKQGSAANWPDYKNFESFPDELRVREYPPIKRSPI